MDLVKNAMADEDRLAAEGERIVREYHLRAQRNDDRYAPWRRDVLLTLAGRRRIAAELLYKMAVFPAAGSRCLEVGYGSLGWLGELMTWGVRETDLHGIELNEERGGLAKERFPSADLRIGDAGAMPWPADSFSFVVTSTVFTSVLDSFVRRVIANEITRVLAPGGALLWYDFAYDNPRNSQVRGIGRQELLQLFPGFTSVIRRVTLAPPIARFIAPVSWTAATFLESLPFLRTHLLGVFVKP